MIRRRLFPGIVFFTIITLITGCVNNEWKMDYYDLTVKLEPGFTGPLVHGSLSLDDMLINFDNSGIIGTAGDKLIQIAYDTLVILTSEYFKLPQQDLGVKFLKEWDVDVPDWALALRGDTIVLNEPQALAYKRLRDERIDSVYLKGGYMDIRLFSDIRHEADVIISSDSIRIDGMPYIDTFRISDGSGNFNPPIETIPLSGSTLIFDNSDPDTTRLAVGFELKIYRQDGFGIIAGEEVNVIQTFRDLEFESVYGYLGRLDSLIVDNEVMEFTFFDDIMSELNMEGTVKFADPQINLSINNSFGLPFAIELRDMQGRFEDGHTVDIIIDSPPNPIEVAAPGLNNVGGDSTSIDSINRTNSNLHEIATTDIREMQYSIRAVANPPWMPEQDNFMLETSEMKVDMELLMPMWLNIPYLAFSTTMEFSAPDTGNMKPSDVKLLEFTLAVENGLPVGVEMQIYFLDDNDAVLDSLIGEDRTILPPAIVDDATGEVVWPESKSTLVIVNPGKIENIFKATQLQVQARAQSSRDSKGNIIDVKFYADDYLDFKLRVRAEVSYTLDPDSQ